MDRVFVTLTLGLQLAGCIAPKSGPADSAPGGTDTSGGTDDVCPITWNADPVHDWATYTFLGTPAADHWLGEALAVGDLDEDGLDDVVIAGNDAPNIYVFLGSTLARCGPGAGYAADVADYTLVTNVNGYSRGGEPMFWLIGLDVRDGELYVGNPSLEPQSAFRVTGETLLAAGPGVHAVGDVADVQLDGERDRGGSIRACDIDGDGERDVVLAAEWVGIRGDYSPGYLLHGPLQPTMDLDAEAVAIEFASDPGVSFCRLGACIDYTGDGLDDFSIACMDPSNYETSLFLFYGSPSLGRSGTLELEASDLRVSFDYDSPMTGDGILAVPESAADWNGDGYIDLLVSSSADSDDQEASSEVSLFLGGAGFFPSGTTLKQADRFASVGGTGTSQIGRGASLAGDLDGDGRLDLVIGRPSTAATDGGAVYVRHAALTAGDHALDSFAEETLTGWVGGPPESEGEALGTEIAASGDTDGNGANDLVIAAPYFGSDREGAVYVILH